MGPPSGHSNRFKLLACHLTGASSVPGVYGRKVEGVEAVICLCCNKLVAATRRDGQPAEKQDLIGPCTGGSYRLFQFTTRTPQSCRRAVTTGKRAARTAGNNPPSKPINTA